MFSWPRPAKNSIAAWRWAGHCSRLGHTSTTRSSSRTSGVPHVTHALGAVHRGVFARSVTASTCGMISPAFSISTRSPSPMPSRPT